MDLDNSNVASEILTASRSDIAQPVDLGPDPDLVHRDLASGKTDSFDSPDLGFREPGPPKFDPGDPDSWPKPYEIGSDRDLASGKTDSFDSPDLGFREPGPPKFDPGDPLWDHFGV